MSRRRVLWATVSLEVEDAAHGSASELLLDAEQARLNLPNDSRFDPLVGELQDACNEFRTHLEQRGDGFPFGEHLCELRAAALQFASVARDELKLREAEVLAEKIDMSTARSPIGEPLREVDVEPPEDPFKARRPPHEAGST